MHDNTYHLWQQPKDILLAEKFLPSGKIIIEEKDWAQQLQKFILPLATEYNVQFNNVKREEIKDMKPEMRLMLREKGDYLLFQPIFIYNGYEVKPNDKDKIIIPQQDRLLVIQRNSEEEKNFIDKVEKSALSFSSSRR